MGYVDIMIFSVVSPTGFGDEIGLMSILFICFWYMLIMEDISGEIVQYPRILVLFYLGYHYFVFMDQELRTAIYLSCCVAITT